MNEPPVGRIFYSAPSDRDAGHDARTTPPALSVEHVSFRYADAARWILRDVSMTVPAGKTTLILGPSGSGKSTLALCLNGLIPQIIEGEMQGEVLVWGQPAASLWSAQASLSPTIGGQSTDSSDTGGHSTYLPSHGSAGEGSPSIGSAEAGSPSIGGRGAAPFVGEVFQDPETQMVMPRVDEEIAFGLEGMGVPPGDMPARIAAALALVGLQDRPRAWVDSLSGGQKQRLALAALLAMQPGILVLDEPTANLDPLATVAFFQTLRRLKADLGITIVLIEHRLDAVLPLVDHIVAMNRGGQIIAEGTPPDVLVGHAAELESEGVWLPMTCRLLRALEEHGIPSPPSPLPTLGEGRVGCPLTMDEVEASLRALPMWSATRARPAPSGAPVVAAARMRRQESSHSTNAAGSVATPAISIEHLTFAYPDSPPVLCDVTMQIARGRFFAIVGANGSGKTTLAQHLVGLLRPGSGTVTVLGEDTRRKSPGQLARQAGYVFQNPEHQFVTERVADELAYSLRGRFDAAQITQRVQALLTTFGLAGYEDENPFALSQGQKRRLSVATMVALEQPVLILDEPTFGQDQQSTTALMATLRTLHDAGVTIIFITHDMQLVAEYADEVAVMDGGRVIFQGSPRQLFGRTDIMQQASLLLPPLAELSRRLGLPGLATLADWARWADALVAADRAGEPHDATEDG
jgi:energy-coupling factor transport system ATP-binding protein